MVTAAAWVSSLSKAAAAAELSRFLMGGLALALEEKETTVWFALKLSPSVFGIFDAFPGEAGREAHLSGPIAAALKAKAGELLSEPPSIEKLDVLAAKVPT